MQKEQPKKGLSVSAGSTEGPTVWVPMDFSAALRNVLVTLPLVVLTVAATWNIAELQFLAAFMAGYWLASAHDVLLGWLARNCNHDCPIALEEGSEFCSAGQCRPGLKKRIDGLSEENERRAAALLGVHTWYLRDGSVGGCSSMIEDFVEPFLPDLKGNN